MKKTASSKRYPFSINKHEHDILLRKNYLSNNGDEERAQEVNFLLLRMYDNMHRDAMITWLDGQDISWANEIVAWAENYRAEQMQLEVTCNAEVPQAGDCLSQDMLTIEVPMDGFSEKALANLDKLIASKADSIREMTGADTLPVERIDGRLRFPWFRFTEDGDTVTGYACFIAALCSEAKKACAI